MEKLNECMVCQKPTNNCPPSPFLPYSGWRCLECVKEHRIPLEDLMGILYRGGTSKSYQEAKQQWIEWWGSDDGYAEKYWIPTANFYNLTLEQIWQRSQTTNKS